MNKNKSSRFISSTCKHTHKNVANQGFVLALTLVLILVTSLLASGLVFAARQSLKTVAGWTDYDNALLAAQAAIEKEKSTLHTKFLGLNDTYTTWNKVMWIEEESDYTKEDVELKELFEDTDTPPVILNDLPYKDAVVNITV